MHGMRMEISARMSQVQIMAPRMIQSMEILQMPIMDLQERIQQELDENPVLELKEPTGESDFAPDEPPAPEDRDPGARELVIEDHYAPEVSGEGQTHECRKLVPGSDRKGHQFAFGPLGCYIPHAE